MKLDGVIAVVTGGASGIGRATVSALAKAGAKTVYMLDMNAQLGKSTADEINAELSKDQPVVQFQCCDVTKEETVTELFDCVRSRGEQVNILVNSAGILDEKSWQKTIDVNLKAVVSASYAALEHMGKHNGGQGGIIVNMGSLGGIVVSGFAPIYCATKHAVVAFSRCIADESLYSHHGVRIACICPSYVDTPMVTGRDSKQLYRYEWMPPRIDRRTRHTRGIWGCSLCDHGLHL